MSAATSITAGALFNEYQRHRSIAEQLISRLRTSFIATVVAVTQDGTIAGSGKVDILPLVGQLDGEGNVIPHGIIHGVPYMRLQGGANAVIIDPQVGDIGLVAVCDRDNSTAVSNKGQAGPGSLRKHDMSDSIYVMTILSSLPAQYIAFASDGITIVSPQQISLAAPVIVLQAQQTIGLTAGNQVTQSAPIVEIDGQLAQGQGPLGGNASMQGPLTVNQDVTASGTSVHGHEHIDSRNGTTSPPI